MKFNLSILSWFVPLVLFLKSHSLNNDQVHLDCFLRYHQDLFLHFIFGLVLYFAFNSIIHFELAFVNGVRYVSRFFCYMLLQMSSCSMAICGSLLLLHCVAFSHLSKIIELYLMWVHIWALYSLHLFSVHFVSTTLF